MDRQVGEDRRERVLCLGQCPWDVGDVASSIRGRPKPPCGQFKVVESKEYVEVALSAQDGVARLDELGQDAAGALDLRGYGYLIWNRHGLSLLSQ